MAPFIFKSNQVAVAGISQDLALFDAPIQEGGRNADVFFKINVPIDAIRPAFQLEFNSNDFNGVDADDIYFHEHRNKLYKCFKDDTSGNQVEYEGVRWSEAIPDSNQDKSNKSWVTYTESNEAIDFRIQNAAHGMLLRPDNAPNTLKYEMAEMAVKSQFDAPLDLLDNESETKLIDDVANQDTPINTALRNQLQTHRYSINQSTNGLTSGDTGPTAARPLARGIGESLLGSALSQDADSNGTTDDFLARIDNLVTAWRTQYGPGTGHQVDGVVRSVTDPYNPLLKDVKIESLDFSTNTILMDFPMAVGDKMQITLLFVVQSKLQTADLSGNVTYAVGPTSSRKHQTNHLRKLFGSRVHGYKHSDETSTAPGLEGESLAHVGAPYNATTLPDKNRYGNLFMDVSVDPPKVIDFAESLESTQYFTFMNRVAEIEITLTESGDTTYLKPKTEQGY